MGTNPSSTPRAIRLATYNRRANDFDIRFNIRHRIAEIGKHHPELGRLRLVGTRSGESDLMTLKAETASPGGTLKEELAASLKLGGNVELVAAGSLPNGGKVITDRADLTIRQRLPRRLQKHSPGLAC
jgi:hypothetical protein